MYLGLSYERSFWIVIHLHIFFTQNQELSSNQNLKKWQCQIVLLICFVCSFKFTWYLASVHLSTHTTAKRYRERKNRHLVEIARTLLLGAHIPLHHWGDALWTACFLINRMPSSSLNHKVPVFILFPDNPLFHIPSRVFDCVCFVHDLSPGLAKLYARALKCVFLGYSRLQKGYRCYYPETKKYYMSAKGFYLPLHCCVPLH